MKTYTRLASGEVSPSGLGNEYVGKMALPFVFATPGVARDNHRIMPGAWVKNWGSATRHGLTAFKRNPVILDGHDMTKRVVGRALNIREADDGKLIGAIEFADTQDGRELHKLYSDGFMNGVSVSWLPAEAKPARDRGSGALNFHRAELLEASTVAIPSDENALVMGRKLGASRSPGSFDDLIVEAKREAARLRAKLLITDERTGPSRADLRIAADAAIEELKTRARSRGLTGNQCAQIAAIFREIFGG